MANLLVPMVQNQDVRAEFFNSSIDNMRSVAYQTADVSVTNTASVFALGTDLIIPDLVANAEYIFESCLFYDTTAAADIKIRLRLPFIGRILIAPWYSGTAITGVSNNIDQTGYDENSAVAGTAVLEIHAGGVSAGTIMCIRPTGWIRMSTSEGDLAIDHVQDTPTAVQTFLKQGSWIALTRVL